MNISRLQAPLRTFLIAAALVGSGGAAFAQDCVGQTPPSPAGSQSEPTSCNSFPTGGATASLPMFGDVLGTQQFGPGPSAAPATRLSMARHLVTPNQEPVLIGAE